MVETRRAVLTLTMCLAASSAQAVPKGPYPPSLPGGATIVTDTAPEFIQVPSGISLAGKFEVAKTPPTVDFAYLPGQNRAGNPWSVWGDGVAVGTKYYSAIGDHKFDAYVHAFDGDTRNLRVLLETSALLGRPEGEYRPGKIHSKIGAGKDGCLYYSTHRGSARYTDGDGGKKHKFQGDWVLKTDPATGKSEVLMHGEIPESMPVAQLDPDRLIFYGGTQQTETFFALDCATKKVLFRSEPGQGPQRYMLFARKTGKVYFVSSGNAAAGVMNSYDPRTNTVATIRLDVPRRFDIRSCTEELPGGLVYVCDFAGNLWRFDVATERPEFVGPLSIGKTDGTITSLDADPTGRYLYYVGGSHGGIAAEGMPVKQYDTKTNTIKVLAFLNPFYAKKYNYNPDGSYGSAVSADGSTLFVTMNGCLPPEVGAKNWYAVGLFAIHIPASERLP